MTKIINQLLKIKEALQGAQIGNEDFHSEKDIIEKVVADLIQKSLLERMVSVTFSKSQKSLTGKSFSQVISGRVHNVHEMGACSRTEFSLIEITTADGKDRRLYPVSQIESIEINWEK